MTHCQRDARIQKDIGTEIANYIEDYVEIIIQTNTSKTITNARINAIGKDLKSYWSSQITLQSGARDKISLRRHTALLVSLIESLQLT